MIEMFITQRSYLPKKSKIVQTAATQTQIVHIRPDGPIYRIRPLIIQTNRTKLNQLH